MAQQINLFSPILLQPRRYFSAVAMLQALATLVLGLLALGAWVEHGTAQQRRELATITAAQSAERQRLQSELAGRTGAPADTRALEQEKAQAVQAVAERQRLLAELATPTAAASRAAVLRLIAQTAPSALWLTEVRLAADRLELAGVSLQPEQLRPWLAQLLAQPALGGLALRSVAVEAADPSTRDHREPAWTFRVVAQAKANDAAPGQATLPASAAREGAP